MWYAQERTSAPPPSIAMWMLAADVSVDGVLTALWWSGLTANDRRGCLPPHLLRYTKTYVLRSMLCFGILCRIIWLSTFPAFRKFARVGLPFATHHYKRGRRKVSFSSYNKIKEVDKREKTNFIFPTKANDKAQQRSKPNNHQKNTHYSHTAESTPTIILHAFPIITPAQY